MMSAFQRTLIQLAKVASSGPVYRLSACRRFHESTFANARNFSSAEGYLPVKKSEEEFSILKENIHPKDALMQSMKSATSTDVLLQSVEKNEAGLNPNVAHMALRNLFVLHRGKHSSLSKEDIVVSKTFEKICKSVKSGLRLLSVNNQIETLKVLIYFGVPPTSIMVQSVLHLLKKQVNDLNISEIIFLHTLCRRSQQDSNIKSMEIALPLVFEANLKLKLEREKMSHVAEALDFATKYKVSNEAFDDLITTASKLDIHGAREAYQVARGCTRISYQHPLKGKLCRNALDYIVDNFDQFYTDDIMMLLSHLAPQVKKNPEMYHANFFKECVQRAIAEKFGLYKSIGFAKNLSKASYWSAELIDYICEELILHPDELKSNVWLSAPIILINNISSSGYTPKKWDEVQPILFGILANLPESKFNFNWITIACDLARIGAFDDHVIQNVFDADYLSEVFSSGSSRLDHIQLEALYQAVKLFFPEYCGPLPSEALLKSILELKLEYETKFPLKGDLEIGFGGSRYILDNVITKLNFIADHAVLIRKGGFPVALNQNKAEDKEKEAIFLDNYEIPADSELLLILYMPKAAYSSVDDGNTLKFREQFKLKALDKLGYKTLVVKETDWLALAEHERVAFLMQKIKEKMKDQYEGLSVV
ncbi:uncharacterized protein LOC132195172 isoform X2 [Neocloeon triangulifer]|uniref:uncharacterized protein LOC132195172 isoform X2 n=1 Tax=Neocloeon triangulifer TaxID=2078957 RepID=UPI00286FAA7A|nr:uncharacterized protein LOC132195172 isoform X2 [Neocloeon triangulifer]